MLDVTALRPQAGEEARAQVVKRLVATMERTVSEAFVISSNREAALRLLVADRTFRWNLMMLTTASPEILDEDTLVVGLTSLELTALLIEAVGSTALVWAKQSQEQQ